MFKSAALLGSLAMYGKYNAMKRFSKRLTGKRSFAAAMGAGTLGRYGIPNAKRARFTPPKSKSRYSKPYKAVKPFKAGGFKRKRQSKNRTKKSKSVSYTECSNRGFVNVLETTGTVADPSCVYIGHAAVSMVSALEVCVMALLRKLFAKAQIHIVDILQVIPAFFATNAAETAVGLTIRLVLTDTDTGTDYNHDYALAGGETIISIVGDALGATAPNYTALMDSLLKFATGTDGLDALNTAKPTRLILYSNVDISNVLSAQVLSSINLEQEMCHFVTTSNLKVQNLTTASNNSTDATDVNANHIQGRQYEFRNGAPIYANMGAQARSSMGSNYLLERMYDPTGTLLGRAALLNTNGRVFFSTPPPANNFMNLKASKKVTLAPGGLTSNNQKYGVSMMWLTFLKRLGTERGANKYAVRVPGTASLYAFEDVININKLLNVMVSYEVKRRYGAYFTSTKQKGSQGQVYLNTRSSVPI